MATTSRYTLQGTGANFMDFHIPYGTISLDGQEIVFKGNSGVDQVYVGSAAGLIFDFTQAGLGTDKIYLAGNWADYSRTFSGSVVTFTRTTGGSEVIKSISGDSLIFANGTVSVLNALQFTRGDVGVSEPVPSGETSTAFPMTVAGTLNNTLRAVVQDATGETIALSRPGIAMIVKGGSGVDVVYVTAGANVDGSQLGLGQDKLYLTGNYADYTGSFSGSVVTLTRTVGSDTETVKFLGGSETAYDSVVFANGAARSVDILKFLNGTNVNAPTLNSAELTPLPGPTVTITSNDSSLTVGETATITFTLNEAATDFSADDVTVSAGALSSFSGSGTSYTATFTPPAGTDASTVTIGVAAGTFTNAEAQNNSAGSLVLAVDTQAPSAPTPSLATDSGAADSITNIGTVNVAGVEDGATWQYSTDSGSNWTTGTGTSFILSGDGAKSVIVRQTDAAGNVGASSSALAFTLDTAAAAPTLALNADNGRLSDDLVTNVGTVNVTGVEAGAAWQYSTDSGSNWTTGTGTSFTLSGDGAKSVIVRQTDVAGNLSSNSSALAFTLDTAAPLGDGAPTTGVGSVVDATESAAGFQVTASLNGTQAVAGDSFELKVNGQSFATPLIQVLTAQNITDGSVSFSVAANSLGADGSKALTSVVTDLAGNVGAASSPLTLSLEAGSPTLLSLARQTPSGEATNADTLVYRVTFSEAVSNVSTGDFAVTGSTATVTNVVSAGGNAYDVTVSGGNLASLNGAVTLGFSGLQNITDTGGNALATPVTTASYTLDNTAPTAGGVPTVAAGPLINASESTAGFTAVASLSGTGAVAGDTLELKLGGNSFATPLTRVLTADDISAGTYTFNVAASSLGSDGSKLLTSVVTDAVGNVGAASTALTLTLDTAAPTAASAPTAAAGPTINATESGAGFTVVASVAGIGAAVGDVLELKLGGSSFATPLTKTLTSTEITNGSFTFNVAASSLGSDGAKSLTSLVTDAAGNVGAASTALSLTLDTAAPTLSSLVRQTPSGATTNADTLVYRVTFSEAVSNVSAGDFTETGTSTATVTNVVSAGGNAYDVTVSGGDLASFNGAVTLGFDGAQNITDSAGNALATPVTTASYTLDNTAPTAGGVPTVAAGPLINASESTAGFTAVASLSGTGAVAGDTLELKLGGNSFATPLTRVLTADDISAGTYTFNVAASSLGSDGSKLLTSVVTDAVGNVGAASTALTLTLDTAAPTAASAPTAAAGPTINATEALGFSVVASFAGTGAAVGDILELKLGGSSFATPLTRTLNSTDIQSGSYTFTVTGTDLGSDGAKSLTSVVTDAAGNVGAASTALSLTLDTTASRSISYSAGTFVEAAANDGTIFTTINLTLGGDTFTGTDGQLLNGVTYQNVPSGLTARVTKTSSTSATLELTGTAGAHADANDISNLTVIIGNDAFGAGNATNVTGATKSDLAINFADPGLIFSGNSGVNVLSGTTGNDIIYGNGGADVINGLAGNDTINITDTGTTSDSSALVRITSVANGLDTVVGLKGGATTGGGDVLDFTGIADLADSVATGLATNSNFGANNVFVFNGTQISIGDAATAIAADTDVVATTGYIVIADSANAGRVTVFHSTDLAGDGAETALIILSGVSISSLTAENFLV